MAVECHAIRRQNFTALDAADGNPEFFIDAYRTFEQAVEAINRMGVAVDAAAVITQEEAPDPTDTQVYARYKSLNSDDTYGMYYVYRFIV